MQEIKKDDLFKLINDIKKLETDLRFPLKNYANKLHSGSIEKRQECIENYAKWLSRNNISERLQDISDKLSRFTWLIKLLPTLDWMDYDD